MAQEGSRWEDIKEDIKGFGERITGKDDKPAEELHSELEDSDSEALQSDLAGEEMVDDPSMNRPQFGERIGAEDEMAEPMDDAMAAEAAAEADAEDYDHKAM